ncbi:hypothetical protein DFQ30_006655 [Apophysomyces sp. BC1015]|nr:hypothetical protein DFQ30_006655 [Apophysomyces sp. BC1015]
MVDTEKEKRCLVKDYSKTNMDVPTQESANWSVVPFVSSENKMVVDPKNPLFTKSSLTWWKDPEDPSQRKVTNDLPVGLRPPSYNYSYTPVLIQALFNISLFRYSVLLFCPTPYTWGSPKNYWKGVGESVPGYILERKADCDSDADTDTDTDTAEDRETELKSIPNYVQDPLIYESYDDQDDDSNGSVASDESMPESARYKITTFQQIPPILLILLENRDGEWMKNNNTNEKGYIVDDTIYLDRYLLENKEKSLKTYRLAEQWRKEIRRARSEISKLQGVHDKSKLDKQEILQAAIDFLEERSHESTNDEIASEPLRSTQRILSEVQHDIKKRLAELQQLESNRQEAIKNLFKEPEMQRKPYDLCSTLHHDGMSGTGHYWAYIRVSSREPDFSMGTFGGGQWYRFCDASVVPVTEFEVLSEPVAPFAQFVNEDNEDLSQEEEAYNNADNAAKHFEKLNLPPSSDGASATLDDDDDDFSVGTAIGPSGEMPAEQQRYSSSGKMFTKLKEAARERLEVASKYPGEDHRFLKSLDMFIAKTNNSRALEHLLLTCMDEDDLTQRVEECFDEEDDDAEGILDKKASVCLTEARKDPDLQPICQEFDSYIRIAQTITQALFLFAREDYQNALQYFIATKRGEWAWRTHLMFDNDLTSAYPGLETFNFSRIIEKFGRACIQILSDAAYRKASDPAYRIRGLEDAINVVHGAHAIIGPETISNDSTFNEMRELWLGLLQDTSFSDEQQVLLNTLVMTFLEDQRTNNDQCSTDDYAEFGIHNVDNAKSMLIWKQYREARTDAELHWIQLVKS